MCLTILLSWINKSNATSQHFCVFPPKTVTKKLYGLPTVLGTHSLCVSSNRIKYILWRFHLKQTFFAIRIVLVDAPFFWIFGLVVWFVLFLFSLEGAFPLEEVDVIVMNCLLQHHHPFFHDCRIFIICTPPLLLLMLKMYYFHTTLLTCLLKMYHFHTTLLTFLLKMYHFHITILTCLMKMYHFLTTLLPCLMKMYNFFL